MVNEISPATLIVDLPVKSGSNHNYTRLVLATLRKSAVENPSLSTAADHFQALDAELSIWEARARSLFETGQNLRTRCMNLEVLVNEGSRQIADQIEEFARDRVQWEASIAKLSTEVRDLGQERHSIFAAQTSLEAEVARLRQFQADETIRQTSIVQGLKDRLDNTSNALRAREAEIAAHTTRAKDELSSLKADHVSQLERLRKDLSASHEKQLTLAVSQAAEAEDALLRQHRLALESLADQHATTLNAIQLEHQREMTAALEKALRKHDDAVLAAVERERSAGQSALNELSARHAKEVSSFEEKYRQDLARDLNSQASDLQASFNVERAALVSRHVSEIAQKTASLTRDVEHDLAIQEDGFRTQVASICASHAQQIEGALTRQEEAYEVDMEALRAAQSQEVSDALAAQAVVHEDALEALRVSQRQEMNEALEAQSVVHSQDMARLLDSQEASISAALEKQSALHVQEMSELQSSQAFHLSEALTRRDEAHAVDLNISIAARDEAHKIAVETLQSSQEQELSAVVASHAESHEAELIQLRQTHAQDLDVSVELLRDTHAIELDNLRTAHVEEIRVALAAQSEVHNETLASLRATHAEQMEVLSRAHVEDLAALLGKIQMVEDGVAAKLAGRDDDLLAATTEVEELKAQAVLVQADHAAIIASMEEDHANNVRGVIDRHERQSVSYLTSLQEAHDQELANLRAAHAQGYENEVSLLREAHTIALRDLSDAHQLEVDTALARQKGEHEEYLALVYETHADEVRSALAKQAATHADEVRSALANQASIYADEVKSALEIQEATHADEVRSALEAQASTHADKMSALIAQEQEGGASNLVAALRIQKINYDRSLSEHQKIHDTAIDFISSKHAAQVEELTASIGSVTNALEKERANSTTVIQEVEQFYKAQIATLEDRHANDIADLRADRNNILERQAAELERLEGGVDSQKINDLIEKDEAQQVEILDLEQKLVHALTEVDVLRVLIGDRDAQIVSLGRNLDSVATTSSSSEGVSEQSSSVVLELDPCAHDDSLPWSLRPWTVNDARPAFVPVAGVPEWLEGQGLTVADLGPLRFPSYSSSDREHLAMSAGVSLSEFLALPFVRPSTKKVLAKRMHSGDVPTYMGSDWELTTDGPKWRINKMWKDLLSHVPTHTPMPSWDNFLTAPSLAG